MWRGRGIVEKGASDYERIFRTGEVNFCVTFFCSNFLTSCFGAATRESFQMDSSSLPEEPLQGQGSSNASSQMILRLRQIRTSYMGHLGKLRIEVDSLNLNETEERLRVLVGRL